VEEGRRLLEAVDGVAEARPFFEAFVLLERDGRFAFPLALGLEEIPQNSALLGELVAEQLAVCGGDVIHVVAPQALLQGDGLDLPLPLTVGGTLPARRGGPDGQRLLMAMGDLAGLFGEREDRAVGYELRLRDGTRCGDLVRKLNGELLAPPLRAVSWMEMNGDLLSVLALERAAMFFSMAFIVVVAAFSMGSFLSASVFRRSREMGLLRALGCSRRGIAASFFLQGVAVGALGVAFGVLLALFLLHYRDGLLRLLLAAFGRGDGVLSFYGYERLPVQWSWCGMGGICAFSFAVSCCADLLPALRALRLDPSAALRHGQ
jgi:lipoprotein-releasing system permease protein